MKLRCVCKCGLENYTLGDWVSHWKYGIPHEKLFLGRHPKLRAIWLFLNTSISIKM